MLKKLIRNCFLFPLLILPAISFAQERLTGLIYNPVIHQYNVQQAKGKKSAQRIKVSEASLPLPFFDDFSFINIVPDTSKWIDKNVYINSTYCINPISIGVATFDAIDANGDLYVGGDTLSIVPADTLTSRPIQLAYATYDSLCFSFMYQPGGLGLPPQKTDTFYLEFYAPDQNKWSEVWKASYDRKDSVVNEFFVWQDKISRVWKPGNGFLPSQKFKPVILPLEHYKDTSFLHDGFRFRFRNIATLSKNDVNPGNIGNTAIWNLDYVYLDKKRDSTVISTPDVAMTQPMVSLLKDYESMPWQHFLNNFDNEIKGFITMTYHNIDLDPGKRNVDRGYIVTDKFGKKFKPSTSDNYNATPDTTITYQKDLQSGIFDPNDINDTSQLFKVKSFISASDSTLFLTNDTVRYDQVFSDYYCYDDGTAELGYGIIGQGSDFASVAVKYHCYKTTDSLQAVRICFNKTYQDTTSSLNFYLAVWSDKNGLPDNLIYYKNFDHFLHPDSLLHPKSGGINNFTTYFLDPAVIVPADYYIGWVQTSTDFLNVGYDMNRNASTNTFYNTDGNWYNTSLSGTIMIRPVFGKKPARSLSVTTETTLTNITVFPNPASDRIYISAPQSILDNGIIYSIYNISGQTVLSKTKYNEPINVNGLPKGFYIMKIMDNSGKSVSKKIIITH